MSAYLVPVARLPSVIEAHIVAGLLEVNGISATVSADDVGGTEPHLQWSAGVRVLVPIADQATAQQIIAEAHA